MCDEPCVHVLSDGAYVGVGAEKEEVREYRVKCLNNLATAQLRLEQFDEALHTSRDVLTLEPNNVKALFRTGKVRDLNRTVLQCVCVCGWGSQQHKELEF